MITSITRQALMPPCGRRETIASGTNDVSSSVAVTFTPAAAILIETANEANTSMPPDGMIAAFRARSARQN